MTIGIHLVLDASAAVCALFCLRMLHGWFSSERLSLSLPPGPKGLPLIGNYFDMQKTDMWEVARKWGERYGPLVYVKVFGTSYIFLNSYQTAVDLFEKRGSIYSSRPRIPMVDIEGWNWFVVNFPYGEELRSARRLLHRFFQPTVVSEYYDLQTQSAYRMLERLLDTPDSYLQLLRQSAGESILLVAYGYRPLLKDDPYITLIEKCIESASAATSFSPVNAFPPLQYLLAWLPGGGFQKTVEEGRKLSTWFAREPYEMAMKKIMSNGTAAPSMTSKLMDTEMADNGIANNEALIAQVTGIAYIAGADTTVSALHTFLLAILLYPEVQQRAQEELDKVVGKDTLPSLANQPKLPYVDAIVKEIFRWQPVLPLSVPHTVDEVDEYKGYLVPAGATVLLNTWAITRDPETYPEPEKFIPERWLPPKGKEPPLYARDVIFGVCRRICSGRHFADNAVFITAASILSVFNITKALDKDGAPITPRGNYKGLTIRHPEPFKYTLTPRSDKIGPIIRQTVEYVK